MPSNWLLNDSFAITFRRSGPLGFRIKTNKAPLQNPCLYVSQIRHRSLPYLCGLRVNDIVVAINGRTNLSETQANDVLQDNVDIVLHLLRPDIHNEELPLAALNDALPMDSEKSLRIRYIDDNQKNEHAQNCNSYSSPATSLNERRKQLILETQNSISFKETTEGLIDQSDQTGCHSRQYNGTFEQEPAHIQATDHVTVTNASFCLLNASSCTEAVSFNCRLIQEISINQMIQYTNSEIKLDQTFLGSTADRHCVGFAVVKAKITATILKHKPDALPPPTIGLIHNPFAKDNAKPAMTSDSPARPGFLQCNSATEKAQRCQDISTALKTSNGKAQSMFASQQRRVNKLIEKHTQLVEQSVSPSPQKSKIANSAHLPNICNYGVNSAPFLQLYRQISDELKDHGSIGSRMFTARKIVNQEDHAVQNGTPSPIDNSQPIINAKEELDECLDNSTIKTVHNMKFDSSTNHVNGVADLMQKTQEQSNSLEPCLKPVQNGAQMTNGYQTSHYATNLTTSSDGYMKAPMSWKTYKATVGSANQIFSPVKAYSFF